MSHFTVMVINTNGSTDYQTPLAPYDENLEVDPYWEEQDPKHFIQHYTSVSRDHNSTMTVDYTANKGKSLKELVDEYGKEWYKEIKFENDKLYRKTTYNPNSKWDWYQLGGRWAGFLKLKSKISELNKAFGDVVEPNFSFGWTDEQKEEISDGTNVDMGFNKNIDWEGMMAETSEKARQHWDEVASIMGVVDNKITQPKQSWEELIDLYDIDEARKIWHKDPIVKKFNDSDLRRGIFGSIGDYNMTKEEYIATKGNGRISTFAVLLDGKWISQGEMGWWGMSSATQKEEIDWNKGFYERFIKDLNPDAFIAIIDCHI